jgi:quercetin dioxygenase-like cupin family protein
MRVVDIRGTAEDVVVGPEQGATRIFIWCVTEPAGEVLALHHHHGEELFRVLYGRLRFQVGGETREVGPGEVIIVPPNVEHAHVALEDTELEVIGEIGSGVFITVDEPGGTGREQELFVRGVPWSRVPDDESQYVSREEQLRQFRRGFQNRPII